jgi:hypothetical protein
MKAEIIVPEGYTAIRRGTLIQNGDRYFYGGNWRRFSFRIGHVLTSDYLPAIRPQKKKPSTPPRRPAK